MSRVSRTFRPATDEPAVKTGALAPALCGPGACRAHEEWRSPDDVTDRLANTYKHTVVSQGEYIYFGNIEGAVSPSPGGAPASWDRRAELHAADSAP